MRISFLQKVNALIKDLPSHCEALVLILHELVLQQGFEVLELVTFGAWEVQD